MTADALEVTTRFVPPRTSGKQIISRRFFQKRMGAQEAPRLPSLATCSQERSKTPYSQRDKDQSISEHRRTIGKKDHVFRARMQNQGICIVDILEWDKLAFNKQNTPIQTMAYDVIKARYVGTVRIVSAHKGGGTGTKPVTKHKDFDDLRTVSNPSTVT